MAGMERPGTEASRDRVLSNDELAKVWRAAGELPSFGSLVKLLILTGARREEIGQLKWSEIEGDTIKLSNGRTKTGVPQTIPLSHQARELLAGIPRISDFVFTTDGVKPVRHGQEPRRGLTRYAALLTGAFTICAAQWLQGYKARL